MSTEKADRTTPPAAGAAGRRAFLRLAGAGALAGTGALLVPAWADAGGGRADLEGEVPGPDDRAAAAAPISHATVVIPLVFPVLGGATYRDTFLACRGTGCSRRHLGQDLMAPKLRPLVATFDGTVTYLTRERAVGQGNYLSIRSDDGWTCNYLHVNNDRPGRDDGAGTGAWAFAPGLRVGARVFAGQHVAWVGDSGNAESTAPHCHFELRRGDAWAGTVYNPKPSLDRARRLATPRASGPHPEGVLLTAGPGSGVHLLTQGRTRRVHDLALGGWQAADVLTVQAGELGWYPRGAPLPAPDGLVLREESGGLWVVAGGEKVRVPDVAAALDQLRVPEARIRAADGVTMTTTPTAADQTPLGAVRPGALLRTPAGVFRIEGGLRRHVPDQATLASWGWSRDDVAPADEAELASVPPGPPVLLRDGTLVRAANGAVYLISGGTRRWIPSRLVLDSWRYPAARIRAGLPGATIARVPLGPPLP
jgi:murein DD-endopeptidase MepM/ murein hydrolase activator NlpD